MKTLYFFILGLISINLIQDFFTYDYVKEGYKLLWIGYKEDLEKILTKDDQYPNERIFYRRIASNTNERTMISTLSPKNYYCVSIK
ncbi:conserved hypothetical protein [Borreliella burgdorferi 72a]|uniref:Uncharacterized protein n=1 Tax=Borreliella burgdorferi 118a TaxID=476210 RepID=A0A7U8EX85_BORBG|nr:conserved hypothetical protein [Borreliella burgdorferi 72a]EEG98625.1 conserved hypothetical protein [Borreliella burgdorferi 118a]PRQ99613.1 hypothetical protein CV679_04310 [Borreliella burgdorferi]PRR42877.1 hypothetical protein CV672_06135 [Borreliella burgdorferi]